jgi:formylmethanofuran dehydrogenase subunit E
MEKIMEKVEEKIVKAKRKIHKFYCDKCGKYLGGIEKYEEYDDGYYEEIGYITQRIVINGKQYLYKRHLCDKCKENFYEDLGNAIETIGFVKV